MKEDLVPFELAKKLKEKGFYYKCVATYDNDCMLGYNYIQPTNIRAIGFDDCLCSHNVENDGCIDAPTISQVLKWLREEKKIHIGIVLTPMDLYKPIISIRKILGGNINDISPRCFYEAAALAGIEYVIDNLI